MEPTQEQLNTAIATMNHGSIPSISLLQRRMKIGYEESENILQKLEEDGIITAVNPDTGIRRFDPMGANISLMHRTSRIAELEKAGYVGIR